MQLNAGLPGGLLHHSCPICLACSSTAITACCQHATQEGNQAAAKRTEQPQHCRHSGTAGAHTCACCRQKRTSSGRGCRAKWPFPSEASTPTLGSSTSTLSGPATWMLRRLQISWTRAFTTAACRQAGGVIRFHGTTNGTASCQRQGQQL